MWGRGFWTGGRRFFLPGKLLVAFLCCPLFLGFSGRREKGRGEGVRGEGEGEQVSFLFADVLSSFRCDEKKGERKFSQREKIRSVRRRKMSCLEVHIHPHPPCRGKPKGKGKEERDLTQEASFVTIEKGGGGGKG